MIAKTPENDSNRDDRADMSSTNPPASSIGVVSDSTPASRYVEQIKSFVKSRAVSTDELLERLDRLSEMLQDEALLLTSTSHNVHLKEWRRMQLRPVIGSLSNEPDQASDGTIRSSFHGHLDLGNEASQGPQVELSSASDSDDQDSSFARLSFLLEKSIHEGRDALASPASGQRTNRTPHRAIRESTFSGSPLRPPLLSTSSARFFQGCTVQEDCDDTAFYRVGELSLSTNAANDNLDDDSDPEPDDLLDGQQGGLPPPPAYIESRSTGRRSLMNAPQSLVDDGIAALESLIDQLTANTLSGRAPSGLTSNNLLVVLSFFILVVAYLAANQYGTIGVNCHCTCPDLTTSG